MPGLVTAIHDLTTVVGGECVDAWAWPGHDVKTTWRKLPQVIL
jgi:hypothetical protein